MNSIAKLLTVGIFGLTALSVLETPGTSWAVEPASIPDLTSSVKGGKFETAPPAGHHFNVKAPAHASEGTKSLKVDLTLHQLTVRLPENASEQDLAIEVFICDDANTFCLKKKQSFRVPAVAKNTVSAEPKTGKLVSAAQAAPAHFEKETGFYVNDPEKAFALAAQKKLPLMIDFFGIWCPPCNHLDAMVFRSAEFKTKTGPHFVHLKLDADQDRFNELKNRYKIQGLPTVVFTTSSGDEISRLLGYHPLEEMLVKSELAYKNREEGYAQLEALASGDNAEARYKAARIALDRDEPAKALVWLAPLKEMLIANHDPRVAELYRAQLGMAQTTADKKAVQSVLEKWLKEFPDSPDAIENYQTLADIQEAAGDAAGSKASLSAAVGVTEKLIAGPMSALKGTEYTPADLAEARAELFDKLGDTAHAPAAYRACAEAFRKEAIAEGTPFPRGPNLELAYCLGKAGDVVQSEALYREGIRRYPGEYTFYQGLAKLWLDSAKDAPKALPEAKKAVHFAYGNQRLKATLTVVRAYETMKEPEHAIEAIEAELGTPTAEVPSLSTTKLRERLRAKAEELKKKLAKRTATG